MADSSDLYVLLNQLADEFTERSRRGERPTLDEYCAKHPELADDIRELFPAMVELEDAHAATESNDPPPVAEVLGDFRLIREIGRGGMGAVFEAEQISLGRRVALKLLTQRLLRNAKQLRRFEREARSTAKLHHTNIVPVHGFGEHEGVPYFVMQYIHGQPLDAVIREIAAIEGKAVGVPNEQASAVARSLYGNEPIPPIGESDSPRKAGTSESPPIEIPRPPSGEIASDSSGFSSSVVIRGRHRKRHPRKLNYWQGVARIGSQVAQALEYAHGQGVIHRDVKPSNLLLDTSSTVWVTDFGLAKADAGDNLTTTGDVIGTLRYMAPEALDGRTDVRSDVYSLGLTLYEMLALRPAFEQRDRNALIKQVAEAVPSRLRAVRSEIPADLETIVHKAIEREPGRRYSTAGEFADDLQRFLNDEPIRARRQTSLEAVWRWTRQHRAVATLLSMVMTLTLALAVGGAAAAAYYRRQETEQRKLAAAKTELAETNSTLAIENDAARREAQTAKERAERVVWEMQTSRGDLASEADDPARAALWFASAAKQSEGDAVRQAGSLLRARNWLRETHAPLRAFRMPTVPSRVEFRAGSDLLLLVTNGRLIVRDWRAEKDFPWTSALVNVSDARFSPDGETVAIAFSADAAKLRAGGFEIRDAHSGAIRHTQTTLGSVQAVAFSGDGDLVAFAGDTVRLMDVATGSLLPPSWKHPAAVQSMTFDSKNELLATACADSQARVFSVKDFSRPAPLFSPVPHRTSRGSPPAFVKPGRSLATVGPGSELLVTDIDTGKRILEKTLAQYGRGHNPKIVAAPNGNWVAMTGGLNTVIHPLSGDTPKASVEHAIWNEDLACTPDGAYVLTASWDYTVRLWSVDSGVQIGSPLPHTEIVQSLSLAPDGRHLATFGNNVFRIWRLGEPNAARVAHEDWNWTMRPSFDGRLLVPGFTHEFGWYLPWGAISNEPLQARDAETGRIVGPPVELKGRLFDSCVAADDRTIASVATDGGRGWLAFHDAYSGRRSAPAYRLPAKPSALAPRPKRNEVAALCYDGSLHSVDASKGVARWSIKLDGWRSPRPPWNVANVGYTGDGASIVVLDSSNQWIELRSAEDGSLRFPRLKPVISGGPIRSFAVSNDGRYLATIVNGTNAAQVWDARTGAALSKPLPHQGDVFGLWHASFTPDGERLLTACIDRQVLLWDWRKGVLACPPMKHADQVYRVEPTPDGRFAMSVTREMPSRLRLWELPSGRQVAPAQQVGPRTWRPPGASLSMSDNGGLAFAGPVNGLTRFDLAEFLEKPAWSADDYQLLAEVSAGQRIEDGHERTLTFDEWKAALDRLAKSRPEHVHPAPADAAERHRRDSQRLRDAGRIPEAIAHAREAVDELERDQSADSFSLGRARFELAQLRRKQGERISATDEAGFLDSLEAAVAARPDDDERVRLLADALLPEPSTSWRPLRPTALSATSGATSKVQPDDSALASGIHPLNEVYSATYFLDRTGISALRLEALPDPSLPFQGPGRGLNGNFILSEFKASLEESNKSARTLKFADAQLLTTGLPTLFDGRLGARHAIDGVEHSFWDVYPQLGRTHALAFEFSKPIDASNRALKVTLHLGTAHHVHHALGRFRVSATTDPHPLREARLRAAYDRAGAPVRLGIARMLRGDWKRAVAPLEKATAAGTLLSFALLDVVNQELGKKAEADEAFEKTWTTWAEVDPSIEEAGVALEALAIRLDSDSNRLEWLARRLRCFAIIGLGTHGIDDFKRLSSNDPPFALSAPDLRAALAVGNGAAELGDWKTAVAAFDAAMKIDPQSAVAREGAALARLARGDVSGGQVVCREALQTAGVDADSGWGAVAGAACVAGDSSMDRQSVVNLTRSLAAAEPNRTTRNGLAEALCRAGDLAGALAEWDQAAKAFPGAAEPRESAFRAIALLKIHNVAEGRRLLEQADADRKSPAFHDARAAWQVRVSRDALIQEAKALLKAASP